MLIYLLLRPASVRALSRLCAIQKFRVGTSRNSGVCVKKPVPVGKRSTRHGVNASKDQYCTEAPS